MKLARGLHRNLRLGVYTYLDMYPRLCRQQQDFAQKAVAEQEETSFCV